MANNFQATPGVATNILNNSQVTPLPTGTVYAGIFKSNRGPLVKQYTSRQELLNYCGPENPATSIGLSSMYDMLTQSENVIGCRIIAPYNSTTGEGDAYAYVVYDNVTGWVVPTTSIGDDPLNYTFINDQFLMFYSIGPGSYYNDCAIRISKDRTRSGYMLYVYDATGAQQESYYFTLTLNENGVDSQTFIETVVNGQSRFINVKVNYDYIYQFNPLGIINAAYYSQYNVATGVSGLVNYNFSAPSGSINSNISWVGFGQVKDALGNIYTAGGSFLQYNTLTSTATYTSNYSVLQFNPNSSSYVQLNNANSVFNFDFTRDLNPMTVYTSSNNGTIYYFAKGANVDNLSNTLANSNTAVTPTLTNIRYTSAFTGYSVSIAKSGSNVWEITIDGGSPVALTVDVNGNGSYSTGGLSFNYTGLVSTTTGTVTFQTNRYHCISYTFNTYSFTDLGPIVNCPTDVSFSGQPGILINDGSGNLFLIGQVNSASMVGYKYTPSTNTLSTTTWTMSILDPQQNGQLFYYSGNLYLTGGLGASIDANLYSIMLNSSLSASVITVAWTTPIASGFNQAMIGMIGNKLAVYGGSVDGSAVANNYIEYNMDSATVEVNTTCINPYASFIPTQDGIFPFTASSGLTTLSGALTGVLGASSSTIATSSIYSGSLSIINSLLGREYLYLGQDSDFVTSSNVITSLVVLEDQKQYPRIDVIADCGFNDASVSIALNTLMSTRSDDGFGSGIAVLSMPSAYQRNATSGATYRNSLNINNGNSYMCSPGQYVRINTFTGNYQLFPISGAIAATFARNDNQFGIGQAVFGPTFGLCSVIEKLPPLIEGTPLTLNYTQISYPNPDVLGVAQVNIIGPYTSQYPGIYITNNLVLDSSPSLLQNLSIKRVIMDIAIAAKSQGYKYLARFNDAQLRNQVTDDYSKLLDRDYKSKGWLYLYEVICNDENNTPEIINNGVLAIQLQVWPSIPIKGIQITIVANALTQEVAAIISQG